MSPTSTANPLRLPSACLIQPLPADRPRPRSGPVRSSARLISRSTATTASLPRNATPATAAALSISSDLLKSKRGRRKIKSTYSIPKPAQSPAKDWAIPVACSATSPAHPPGRDDRRLPSGPALTPLITRFPSVPIHNHRQSISVPSIPQAHPIRSTTTPKPSSSRSSPLSSSHPSSPAAFSFPAKPLVSPFIFHFSTPTPACHPPPPHPGPLSRPSVPPPSQASRSLPHRPQFFPIWPSTSLSSSPSPPRAKSRVALPQEHYIRSKKIKLSHSFFRSALIFHPTDHYSFKPQALSCKSQIPPRSCTPYSPITMASNLKTESTPSWLHTSAAAAGHSSHLAPKEQSWTGNPQNWCTLPVINRSSSSRSPTLVLQPSPPPQSAPSVLPHLQPRPSPLACSQATPLKAQLLAVLRMRSSHQPGEAALKLKKWVIWNSWVRGQAQNRFYPIAHAHLGPITTGSPQLCSSNIASSSGSDEWTGDEMFDENGDLICDNDLDAVSDEEDELEMDLVTPSQMMIPNPPISPPTTPDPTTKRSQAIIRLKLSPRITHPNYSHHLTPPSSPTPYDHQSHDMDDDLESQKVRDDCHESFDGATKLFSQINVSSNVDQSLITPPPSPCHCNTC